MTTTFSYAQTRIGAALIALAFVGSLFITTATPARAAETDVFPRAMAATYVALHTVQEKLSESAPLLQSSVSAQIAALLAQIEQLTAQLLQLQAQQGTPSTTQTPVASTPTGPIGTLLHIDQVRVKTAAEYATNAEGNFVIIGEFPNKNITVTINLGSSPVGAKTARIISITDRVAVLEAGIALQPDKDYYVRVSDPTGQATTNGRVAWSLRTSTNDAWRPARTALYTPNVPLNMYNVSHSGGGTSDSRLVSTVLGYSNSTNNSLVQEWRVKVQCPANVTLTVESAPAENSPDTSSYQTYLSLKGQDLCNRSFRLFNNQYGGPPLDVFGVTRARNKGASSAQITYTFEALGATGILYGSKTTTVFVATAAPASTEPLYTPVITAPATPTDPSTTVLTNARSTIYKNDYISFSGVAKNMQSVYIEYPNGASRVSRTVAVGQNGVWSTQLEMHSAGTIMVTFRANSSTGPIIATQELVVQSKTTTNTTPNPDEEGYIKVLNPNGGESVKIGDMLTVQWESRNCSRVLLDMYNDRNGDSEYESYYTFFDSNDIAQLATGHFTGTSYTVKIPQSMFGYTTAIPHNKIKATCAGGALKNDWSDQTFAVTGLSPSPAPATHQLRTMFVHGTIPTVLEQYMPPNTPASQTPTVTSITPSTATVGQAATFTISGSNFQSGAVVKYTNTTTGGSGTLTPKTLSSSSITLDVAPGAAGTLSISVQNPGGGISGSKTVTVYSAQASVPNTQPAITVATPATAKVGERVMVVITGMNFQSGAVIKYTNTTTGGSGTLTPSNVGSSMTSLIFVPGRAGVIEYYLENPNGSKTNTKTIVINE